MNTAFERPISARSTGRANDRGHNDAPAGQSNANGSGEISAETSAHHGMSETLTDIIEELSIISRTLERWSSFSASIGVSEEQQAQERARYLEAEKRGSERIAEHTRRLLRKLRKAHEEARSAPYTDINVPSDLISHLDGFLSPNLWLIALFDESEYFNDMARGELIALGQLSSNLNFYLSLFSDLTKQCRQPAKPVSYLSANHNQPDVALSSVATQDNPIEIRLAGPMHSSLTEYAPPVTLEDGKVDLAHILPLLHRSLQPYPLPPAAKGASCA